MINWFPDDNSRLVYRINLKFCTLIRNDTRKKPIVWGRPPVKFCTVIHNDARKNPIVWCGPPLTGSGGRRGGQTVSG